MLASLPVENGVARRGAVDAVGGQAGVVALIQRVLDDTDVGPPHHRRLEHEQPWLDRRRRAWSGRVGGAAEGDDLRGVDHDQHVVVAYPGGRWPAMAMDAAVAIEAVNVARPAIAADREQRAVPVAGNDLGVVGDAVAVPVEEHDVAVVGLPAVAGRAVRPAVIDGVGAVGEAGPASRLHRWEGNLRSLVDVGDVVAAPRLRGVAQIGAEGVRAIVALAVAVAVVAEGDTDDLVPGRHHFRMPLSLGDVYPCICAAQRVSALCRRGSGTATTFGAGSWINEPRE